MQGLIAEKQGGLFAEAGLAKGDGTKCWWALQMAQRTAHDSRFRHEKGEANGRCCTQES